MSSLNKRFLCNHFKTGTCNFGDLCIFSHDESTAIPIPENVCLFNLKGICRKSVDCLYVHRSAEELLNGKVDNDSCADKAPESKALSSESCTKKDYLASSSVIKNKSFANATATNLTLNDPDQMSKIDLCSFYQVQGFCPYRQCHNVHGDLCELCGQFALHPFNEQRRQQHTTECVDQIEKDMEESFAFERSKDLTCGICLDVILEKDRRAECRFGLLTNCDHVFCLGCIREWRATTADQRQGCPQCRTKSFFVIPSEYFYDKANNKEKVIEQYKKALSSKPCKYFKQNGKCPFYSACFYAHKDAQGNPVILQKPEQVRRLTDGFVDILEDEETLWLSLAFENDLDDSLPNELYEMFGDQLLL